jgi:hypothetical protein
LDGEGGVEGGAGFRHCTGDIEEAVSDRSQRPTMTVPAAFESGVFGPALGVMLDGNERPMVHGVAELAMAGLSSDDNAAFARPLGNRRDPVKLRRRRSASSVAMTVFPTPGKDARISIAFSTPARSPPSEWGGRSGCRAVDARF